jgi:hypothetical protein
MTQVRITHPDVVHDVGDEVDVPEAKAERLVNIGYAEYVNASDAPTVDTDDDTPEAPAQSALKGDWVDHAVASGADRDEAEAMTKAELVERYG